MIRTPKTLIKTCHCCHRPGWEVTEHFALLTEEEQEKILGHLGASAQDPRLPKDAEKCWAGCDSTIGEAIKEGIEIATAMDKRVAFEFNGEIVILTRWSNPDAEYRRWWQAVYHETPEESWAKR